ncbi:hypothetical protein BSPLISOX_74 [uncultured Gammaproteobacteria bacterium]|nr:hypothetical protein [uncultured Gammaproteobacteria bacterium]VVH66438.1 hypothetical protein BSPLISOX_74 [uncultured Gammaproteobacteria bacterium]
MKFIYKLLKNIKITIVIYFLGITSTAVYAVNISLTADNFTPSSPGDVVHFSASVGSGSVSKSIVLIQYIGYGKFGRIVQNPLYSSPYEWNFTIPKTSGLRRFEAVTIVDGKRIASNAIKLFIKPNDVSLKSLLFSPGDHGLLRPGGEIEMNLFGLFSDGKKYNLIYNQLGTVYSENIINGITTTPGDSPVISVSADGLVTALQPGAAEVVATNNGKTAVRRITVRTVRENDADGDNLTDAQENAIGTNKYHPDSDGDGSSDGTEVGSDASKPLDADNDGTIDALDNRVVVIKDSSGNYVSIRTSAGKLFNPYGEKISDYPVRSGELAKIDMQRGLLRFYIEDLTPGQTVDVILDFDSLSANTNKYLKYGSKTSGQLHEWYEFDNFEISGNRITLHLTDQSAGDSNPVAGAITEIGGPGSNGSGGVRNKGTLPFKK